MRIILGVLLPILAVSACAGAQHRTADRGPGGDSTDVQVSLSRCAPGWVAQRAGRQHFTVRNTGSDTLRVTLIDAGRGAIYGQVWSLPAHASRTVDPLVPHGQYRWRCIPLRGSSSISPVRTVRGDGGRDARPLVPLSAEEILAAMDAYHTAVGRGLATAVRDTGRLTAAVAAGDLATARTRWLTAHLDYERLGAAYGTFGDSDGAINGRPDGLPRRSTDPSFTGFLRLEYGLWHGQPAAGLRPVAAALDTAVRHLARTFPTLQIVPADIPLRTHEILENTLQFELTGDSDQGSHSNLATARANVDGTRMVLATITAPLRVRDPQLLADAQHGLTALARTLDADRGRPVSALTRSQRQRLNAQAGAVLERLALIPDVLQMPPSTAPS